MTATLTYEYSVRDRNGKVVTGKLQADSQATVVSKLKSMGYSPLTVTAQKNAGMKKDTADPRLQDQGQAQGPGDHVPAVRRHDQLQPLAAAGPDDLVGAD